MDIQLPLTISTEKAVLEYLALLSSFAEEQSFIQNSKKIKALVSKTGDLQLQLYFKSNYEALLLKREESNKRISTPIQSDAPNNKKKSYSSFSVSYDEQNIKSEVSPVMDTGNRPEMSVLNEWERKIEELRNRIFQLGKQKKQAILLKTEAECSNNDLQKTLLTKDNELKRYQDNLQDIANQNIILKSEKIKLETKIRTLTNHQSLNNNTYSSNKEGAKGSIPILRHDKIVNSKEVEINALNERLEKFKKDSKDREQELQKRIQNLTKELTQIKKNNTSIDNLNAQWVITKAEKGRCEEENRSLRSKNEDLKLRFENLQKYARGKGILPESSLSGFNNKSVLPNETDEPKYKGGNLMDGSLGFSNERRENGRMGSLSSFDNYNDDFNELYPEEDY